MDDNPYGLDVPEEFDFSSLSQPALPPPLDVCPNCICQMDVRGFEYICPSCGHVSEEIYYEENTTWALPPLRVVGSNSAYYQRDLDRSSVPDTAEARRARMRCELRAYNEAHRERGYNMFPTNVLEAAIDIYSQVPGVHRCKRKRALLAAALTRAGVNYNFNREAREILDFVQLMGRGVSPGKTVLRTVLADQPLTALITSHAATACIRFGLKEGSATQKAVEAVVAIMVRKNIGTAHLLRTKTIAATYEVFCRAYVNPPLHVFVRVCKLSRGSVVVVAKVLSAYHSHFQATYALHGLCSTKEIPHKRPGVLPVALG